MPRLYITLTRHGTKLVIGLREGSATTGGGNVGTILCSDVKERRVFHVPTSLPSLQEKKKSRRYEAQNLGLSVPSSV